MTKKLFRAVYALNYCMQAGFSMICPAGLFIFGGWLLTNRCGVGRWAMALAIVIGVLTGLYCMFHFLFTTAYAIDPTQGSDKGDSACRKDQR